MDCEAYVWLQQRGQSIPASAHGEIAESGAESDVCVSDEASEEESEVTAASVDPSAWPPSRRARSSMPMIPRQPTTAATAMRHAKARLTAHLLSSDPRRHFRP